MTTHEIKHKINIERWADQLQQQQESGMTAGKWCEDNNIPISTFTSHNRAVRREALKQSGLSTQTDPMCFSENVTPRINLAQIHLDSPNTESSTSFRTSDIHIEFRGISIDINNTADREHMAYILGVLLNVK